MDYLNRQNNKPTTNYTYPSLLLQAAYATVGRTPQEAIFSSIPRLNPRSIKIKGFEDGKGAFVDTRSDTTYKGRHEGRIPVGAGYSAVALGPLALLSMFDIPSVVNNPYTQIGIAPTPGKVTYTPKQMAELYLKRGAEFAKELGYKTFMGPNGKMYARTSDGGVRSFESLGKDIVGPDPITYTAKKFKPVKKQKSSPVRIRSDKKTYYYGLPTANDFE